MPTQRSSKTSKPASKLSCGDLPLLRLVSEQGAIPLDQLAAFLGMKLQPLRLQVKRLERAGWLVSDSFAADRYVWLRATRRGARRVGTGYAQRPPCSLSLNHRRGVNEARIELSKEFPNGRWISEGAIVCRDGRLENLPDGELELDGSRWAIEAELSRKSTPRVRDHVDALLRRYDKVLYFCSDHVLATVERAQADFPADRFEVREAKTAKWFAPPPKRRLQEGYRATAREVKLLRLIVEEGAVAVDQLAVLTGRDLAALELDLVEMESHGLIERGFDFGGSPGWVWCTWWGADASGTGMRTIAMTSPSSLHRRRAFMSVRLALTGGRRQGRWLTRRMLSRGVPRGIPVEMAVLEQRGKRSAIMVSPDVPGRPSKMVSLLGRLSDEHDAVLWYCAATSYDSASRLTLRQAWENVETRLLPVE